MLRSLFSGVAGLKSHQTRMDTIGNNIANVNTTGFKSSRTTFADTLFQTVAGASSPTDNLGGTNPKQIGLGTGVASLDTIFTDGSVQSTGKNTDLCLSGNGLFVVKSSQGTYYTRDGAFEFDANGNYVLPGSGLYVQGWTATNGTLNTSGAAGNITIESGKSMASAATNTITYSKNVNADTATISKISITGEDGSTITVPSTSTDSYAIGSAVSSTIASEKVTFANGVTISSATGSYAIGQTYKPSAMTVTLADGTVITCTDETTGTYAASSSPSATVKTLTLTDAGGDTITAKTGVAYTNGGTYSGTVSSVSGSGPYTLTMTDGTVVTSNTSVPAGGTYTSGTLTITGTLSDGATFVPGTSTSCTIGSKLTSTIASMAGTINGDAFTATSGSIVPSTGMKVSGLDLTLANGATVAVSSSDTNAYQVNGTYSTKAKSMTLTLSDSTTKSVSTGTASYAMGEGMPLSTTATVYDSLGNAHTVPILVTKTAANTWKVSLAKTSLTEDDGTTTTLSMNDITLKFTSDGKYTSGSGSLSLTYGNGAAAQTAAIDLSTLTQYSGSDTINASNDGNAAGTLKSVSIDSTGTITGTYTNGVKQTEAQIAIAQFNNASGLTKTGTSLYQESNNSGTANVKTASDLGVTITPSSLEMSNVDIANEFSDMIITQRGFQSNSKIITVGDEMLETLINMKR